ncbi:histone-fold-containing protein [Earliella scabrosa]|nr:histone-fold-containing protein [Earliella scabrosa]
MPRAKEPTGASTAQAQQDAVADGIDNFELPRSLIMKLARASQVPENTKFSKEVILAILKASTVFINYLAATAHEVASQKQHKSISATDVLKALELVEFGDIAKNIQGELQVYRDLQKSDKRKGGKGKAKDTSESASAASRAKGKGKASASAASGGATDQADTIPPIHLPRPSTSAAVASTDPSSEAENDNDNGRSEDVDEDQEMLDQGQEQDPEDDDDEEMEEDEDEGEEPEPLEDRMALEEEELRKDAKGLEGMAQADDAIEED